MWTPYEQVESDTRDDDLYIVKINDIVGGNSQTVNLKPWLKIAAFH